MCVEQTQIVAEELQEHTQPSLLVKDEEDKKLKSPLPPNPNFHEEYNQLEERKFAIMLFLI